MAFNFGTSISTDSVVAKTSNYLKPWDIYDVTFEGCEIQTGNGKVNPDMVWKAVNITFKGEEGVFKKMLFVPDVNDEKATTRPSYDQPNGGKKEYPSTCEEFMGIIGQITYVLSPEGFEKLQAHLPKCKSMDDVVKAFMTIMEKCKGKTTKIKLIGKKNKDGRVNADFPRVKMIGKDGEMFTANNIIGDKLYFSEYEEGQRQAFLNAKPTSMPTEADPLTDTKPSNTDDVEFDLADL